MCWERLLMLTVLSCFSPSQRQSSFYVLNGMYPANILIQHKSISNYSDCCDYGWSNKISTSSLKPYSTFTVCQLWEIPSLCQMDTVPQMNERWDTCNWRQRGCIHRCEWMLLTICSESHVLACWLLAEAQGTVVIGLWFIVCLWLDISPLSLLILH